MSFLLVQFIHDQSSLWLQNINKLLLLSYNQLRKRDIFGIFDVTCVTKNLAMGPDHHALMLFTGLPSCTRAVFFRFLFLPFFTNSSLTFVCCVTFSLFSTVLRDWLGRRSVLFSKEIILSLLQHSKRRGWSEGIWVGASLSILVLLDRSTQQLMAGNCFRIKNGCMWNKLESPHSRSQWPTLSQTTWGTNIYSNDTWYSQYICHTTLKLAQCRYCLRRFLHCTVTDFLKFTFTSRQSFVCICGRKQNVCHPVTVNFDLWFSFWPWPRKSHHAKYANVISFKSYYPYTHINRPTHWPNCSTWTTKVLGSDWRLRCFRSIFGRVAVPVRRRCSILLQTE